MEYRLKTGENVISFHAEKKGDHRITLSHDNTLLDIDYTVISRHHQHLVINGSLVNAYLADDGNAKTVVIRGIPYSIRDADILDTRARGKKSSQALPQDITPPMPSVVVRILVSPGDRVKQGQGVIVVSSMKMETTLTAPSDGMVKAVNVAEGDKVMPGQILVDIDKDLCVGAKEESQPG
jgi:3-methylcrotonyl-CoA carboxylase alpha subunit